MNLGFPEMIFLNEFKAQIESEISQLDIEQHRQTILPPVQVPADSIASSGLAPTEISAPETNSLAKAPDA